MVGADYFCVKDYSRLTLETGFFDNHAFEIGIVYGWQRLIPEHILNKFNQGIFGFHASPDLLPQGRGRSPLNWGLILGKSVMYNHLFRYNSNADAGDVYSITPFAITAHDTILTPLYKSLMIAKKEITKLITDASLGALSLTAQKGASYFFPKRSPDDGLIDFGTQSTMEIVNLIRGVTKPFSGAFCFTKKGERVVIFEAWEFDALIDFSSQEPGEVIDNLYGLPIVKTIDGSIVIKHYEGTNLTPTDRLISHEHN